MSLSREIDAVFLIADLVGYTALNEAMGGREAVKVIDRYVKLAETALVRDARIVERVGDELLVVAAEPVPVIETVIQIRDAVETEPMFPDWNIRPFGWRRLSMTDTATKTIEMQPFRPSDAPCIAPSRSVKVLMDGNLNPH